MDFHCHLDLYADARRVYAETIQRVEFTWLVTTSPRAYAATSKMLLPNEKLQISPGMHPEVADKKHTELPLLLEQIAHASIVGEVGLDGSPQYRRHFKLQRHVFSSVVQRCEALGGRVLSIHSRAASARVLDTLEQHPGFGTAVLHWFTDSVPMLERAVELGCWFSVGPAMLQAANGRRLAAEMPRDRVVTESDGPFARVAGALVMPWQTGGVSSQLSEVWGIAEAEAVTTLQANAVRLISRMAVRADSW